MEKDKSIHKTSTGKLFQLIDLEGNPMDYEKCKGIFTRSYMAALEVGQTLIFTSTRFQAVSTPTFSPRLKAWV